MSRYLIMYCYPASNLDAAEEIDSADTKFEATQLLHEYRQAYGPNGRLWLKRETCHEVE